MYCRPCNKFLDTQKSRCPSCDKLLQAPNHKVLKIIRKLRGFSSGHAAIRLGSELTEWESGKRPSLEKLRHMATTYDVDLQEFFPEAPIGEGEARLEVERALAKRIQKLPLGPRLWRVEATKTVDVYVWAASEYTARELAEKNADEEESSWDTADPEHLTELSHYEKREVADSVPWSREKEMYASVQELLDSWKEKEAEKGKADLIRSLQMKLPGVA
jgi:transcriptional regulator with XRE-family HTH domain